MIAAPKKKYPSIHFDIASADDFSYAEKFDAVFSNATLHWVLKYKQAAQYIYDSRKQNGRFVAEFGGEGNVASIITAR